MGHQTAQPAKGHKQTSNSEGSLTLLPLLRRQRAGLRAPLLPLHHQSLDVFFEEPLRSRGDPVCSDGGRGARRLEERGAKMGGPNVPRMEWEAHKSSGNGRESSERQIEGKRKGTAETFEGWGKLLANVRAESSGTVARRMERSAWSATQ